jgi:hypothetical protein
MVYVGLAIVTSAADTAFAAGAFRALPQHVQGGTAFDVVITVAPPVGTTSAGIEDGPPVGWDVIANISNSGTYDAGNHKTKWGPFVAPSIPPQVSYSITPPIDAQGVHCFTGTASFNGFNQPVQGSSCVQVTPGIPAVSQWGLVVLILLLLTVGTLVVAPRPRNAPGSLE